MINNDVMNVNFAIYDNGKLTEIIKPDHIGLIGIHVNGVRHEYPKNKALEISVIGSDKICHDESRVPVVVSLNDASGLALRLKDFDSDKVIQWSRVLRGIYH